MSPATFLPLKNDAPCLKVPGIFIKKIRQEFTTWTLAFSFHFRPLTAIIFDMEYANHGRQHVKETDFVPITIIGAGFSGIAAGCRIKDKLGFTQFKIFDRMGEVGVFSILKPENDFVIVLTNY